MDLPRHSLAHTFKDLELTTDIEVSNFKEYRQTALTLGITGSFIMSGVLSLLDLY
jgi:hypothetical protein